MGIVELEQFPTLLVKDHPQPAGLPSSRGRNCRAFLGSLFFCSVMCMFLHQYHTVLIMAALQSVLQLDNMSPASLLFFRIVFSILAIFSISINFRIILSISTGNPAGIFIGIAFNLQVSLRRIYVLPVSSLQIHRDDVSSFSQVWFLSSALYSFQHIDPSRVLFPLFWWHCKQYLHFCLFVSSFSLLVYRNMIDFYMLIFYGCISHLSPLGAFCRSLEILVLFLVLESIQSFTIKDGVGCGFLQMSCIRLMKFPYCLLRVVV